MRNARKNRPLIEILAYGVGRSARFIWDHRLGFALGLTVFSAYTATTALPWWAVDPAWAVLAVAVVYDLRHERRAIGFLGRRWVGSQTSRDLVRASADHGVVLRVENVRHTLPGELVDVRLARGQTIKALEKAVDGIAGGMHVADVRVIRDRDDKSHAQLSIVRRDSFETMDGIPWPLLGADRVDVDAGFPFSQDEYGRVVNARLLSRNLLLGGAPDAGKSAALRVLIAACALDPRYKLWLLDAKTEGAEFVHWAPAAEGLVRGRRLEEAVELFARLEERVEQRGREIVARGEVFVQPDMERDVLFIDEVPQYLRVFDSDGKNEAAAVKAIRASIWKLIAVGRWAGMITVLSAQKPTADIVPSESRDLIDHKFALHCNTRAMSDAILGAGAGEEAPANAADIPSGQPGVGYYVGDDGVQKVRAFFLSHSQAREIADRVGQRRLDAELETIS